MIFASDNWAGASDKVIAALSAAARHGGRAYGNDDLTRGLTQRFSELFEREVAVFVVGTGTAANTLGIANYARPGGIVFCHRHAHINVDEAGASEFFGGTKLVGIEGRDGKYTAEALARVVERYPDGNVHYGRPVVASVSEITELGAAYTPAEVAAIATVAKQRGMAVHMDGARFAGAVASLGVTPGGVDVEGGRRRAFVRGDQGRMPCGGGGGVLQPRGFPRFRLRPAARRPWILEGLVHRRTVRRLARARALARPRTARQRDGHAARTGDPHQPHGAARRSSRPPTRCSPSCHGRIDARLKAAGAVFHPWSVETLPPEERPGPDEVFVRLITSFQTTEDEVDAFAAHLAKG